jgi:peptide/nickel transport system substrate-binding protein/microcin C transport system substrate-binding protein
MGAGPYIFEKYDKGQKIVLKKFDKWYGKDLELYKGVYNFDSIILKFIKEENIELEMIKKGDLDYLGLTAEAFVKKTEGAPWGTKVIKSKIENSSVKGYGFIGWNFKQNLFQDKNVRIALAHLMNREEMNKKFRYGMSNLATGPIYLQSEYNPPGLKAIPFNTKKAQDLLAKSGWSDSDKKGILSKTVDGKKVDFKFTMIYANKDSEKYWTMYKEDLKKAGIEMEIKYLEWNSFIKLIDEGKFDAAALGWGGGDIDWDPKQVWHSSSAVVGGSNFISYKNAEVDKLIDQARLESDKKKRVTILRQVATKIAEDAPYVFLFNDRFNFYAHQSRIGKPADTFKYEVGSDHWWIKP